MESYKIIHKSVDLNRKEPLLTKIYKRMKQRDVEPYIIFHRLKKFYERMMQRDVGDQIQREQRAIHDVVASDEKMIVEKQGVHPNCSRSCHGTKLMKSFLSLVPFFVPCAGGTGYGSGQPEHQGHSEIYQSTLDIVSTCPSPREYMQRSLAKCADVCRSYMLDGNCAYHCMRDSSKTQLVEFCAKPEILFDYCPEYDPVDQTIQKDMVTLCNSTSTRNYYNSSDIYFCDPENCLQLFESSVRSGATTLMNESTEMNGGDSQEWYIPLIGCVVGFTVVILIGGIFWLFYNRGRFSGNSSRTGKMTKKRNRNGITYEYHTRLIKI